MFIFGSSGCIIMIIALEAQIMKDAIGRKMKNLRTKK